MSDDCKPQPRASGIPGAGFFNSVETLEDTGKILLWNPASRVGNVDRKTSGRLTADDSDLPGWPIVVNRIIQKI